MGGRRNQKKIVTAGSLGQTLRSRCCGLPDAPLACDVKREMLSWTAEHGIALSDLINCASKNGATALHMAAQRDTDSFVAMLLELRAQPNVVTNDGDTPLIYACRRRNEEAAHALLVHGASTKVRASDGSTALGVAKALSLGPALLERLAARQLEEDETESPAGLAAPHGTTQDGETASSLMTGSLQTAKVADALPAWTIPLVLKPPSTVNLDENILDLESIVRRLCRPQACSMEFTHTLRWLVEFSSAHPDKVASESFQRLMVVYVGCLQDAHVARQGCKKQLKVTFHGADPSTPIATVQSLLRPPRALPEDLRTYLEPPAAPPSRDFLDKGERRDLEALPYVQWPTTASHVWVDSLAVWQTCLPRLNEAHVVAVDTEWGEAGKGPALVQLAVGNGLSDAVCYLVDTWTGEPDLAASLLRWLRRGDLEVIGWSFREDQKRLRELHLCLETTMLGQQQKQSSATSKDISVIDLQRVYMKRLGTPRMPPSLSAAAAQLLGQKIDKGEQCSDWCQRPLTNSQRHYAALDASVLLEIRHALRLSGEGAGCD